MSRGQTETVVTPVDVPSANNSKSATHAAVAITFPASAEHRTVLNWLAWSYSTDPAAGGITITRGGVTVFQVDITKGGPGAIPLPDLPSNYNEAVVVTLADGGAAVVGKLNIYSRKDYAKGTHTTKPSVAT